MRRFKSGDLLIGHGFRIATQYNGAECVVLKHAAPSEIFQNSDGTIGPADYWVRWSCGKVTGCDDVRLRKKRPPEQPSAFSYDEIISMCNDKSITDIRPTETQVREGLKGILQPFGVEHGS